MSLIKTVDRFRYVQHLAVDHEETDVPNVIGRGFPLGCWRCLSMFQNDLEKPTKEAARDELILRHKISIYAIALPFC